MGFGIAAFSSNKKNVPVSRIIITIERILTAHPE